MATLPSTDQSSRIVTLDIIRGVAVMGIFSVNVIAFAMIEAAYFNPAAYGGRTGLDLALWATNMIVIDGKMRTLFSMLFGASMLLVIERAEAAGRSGWWTHFRRMIVLLAFGIIHYYFIWYGDILALYALSGLVAYLFRHKPPRVLVLIGVAFLALHMLLFSAFVFSQAKADVAAHAPHATQAAIKKWNEGLGDLYPPAAKVAKDMALHLGPYLDLLRHNFEKWAGILQNTMPFIPNTIGLMLIGMAGYKSGFLTGDWSNERYRRVLVPALVLGAISGSITVAYDIRSHFYIIGMIYSFIVAETPFITFMAVGYAAAIILLTRAVGPFSLRIAAAGRCAFTNYLGTSLIATGVFYGWGLGLYGSVSRWQAWLLVPVVWSIMLLWSKPWLEHFHYGPFEWAWRSLARGKPQPFRKRTRITAAAAA